MDGADDEREDPGFEGRGISSVRFGKLPDVRAAGMANRRV
jgi:hypothetical protein